MLLLGGCESRTSLAPVVELKWQPRNAHQTTHTVRRGETLYAVAFRYDQDYRQLAAYNHLQRPYALRVGQVLRLRSGSKTMTPTRYIIRKPAVVRNQSTRNQVLSSQRNRVWSPLSSHQGWLWPVYGRVATGFIPQQGKKGIDIAGKKGEKIRAASSGVVAYSGSGLSGYGNLIIIKHNAQFLTAYGNNLRNMVTEGQKVKAGQIIAEMGLIDRRFWGVHFEIRKAGQPVNPLDYLQKG